MRLNLKLIVVMLVLMLAVPFVGSAAASVEAQGAGPILVVNTGNLNVRSGPGAQFAVVTVVPGGTELPVLGLARDRVWYLVSTPAGNGWVNVEFTLARGDFRNVPFVDAPATGGQGGGGAQGGPFRFRVALNVQTVDLRSAPDSGSIIGLIRNDGRTDYQELGRTTGLRNVQWVRIDVPGLGIGWVEAPKTRISLDARYRTVMTIVGESVAVLAQPGGQFLSDIAPLQQRDEVFLLQVCCDGQFLRVELPSGRTGYIPYRSAVTRTGTTTDILASQQGQTGVRPGGTTGASATSPQIALPVAIVNTGNLNARSGPGPQFGVVAVLPGGTRTSVLGRNSNGSWYLVQGDFGQGWVDSDFVIFRGDFSQVVIVN